MLTSLAASPEHARSTSTHGRPRSDSTETLVSSVTAADSTASYAYPDPPVNSPDTQTVVGDSGDVGGLDTDSIAERLRNMPALTPPASEKDGEGKAKLRAPLRENMPLSRQLFKLPAKKKNTRLMRRRLIDRTYSTPSPTKMAEVETIVEEYPEHSMLGPVAEEDVELGLRRLAMLAKDEHQQDGSKSVEEYYSVRLAKLIKKAEVAFDAKHLQ